MITMEQFNALSLDDEVVTDARLFQGLSPEPITLKVVQVDDKHEKIEFLVRWFGIVLGRWVCTDDKGMLKWSV